MRLPRNHLRYKEIYLNHLSKNIQLYLASFLFFFTLIMAWKWTYHLHCFSFLFPIIILIFISKSYIDIKMNEKHCFKNCYLNTNSIIAKIIISRTFVIFFYMLVSIFMTLSLAYAVIDYPWELWVYLFVHFFIVIWFYKSMLILLKGTIKSDYLYIFSRGFTIFFSSVIFFLVYTFIFIHGYEPSYLRESFDETLFVASNSIGSACSFIDIFLRFNRETDGFFWWVMSSSSQNIQDTSLKSSIWIGFVIVHGLAIMGINRFIVQIIHTFYKLLEKHHNDK